MSHLNGLIYIDTSTDPDTGVSIADIQQTLGSGKRDIGGLITSGKINKWSKIKPLAGGGVNYLVAEGTNYKGPNVNQNCGFQNAKGFSSISSFVQAVGTFFSYVAPAAGNKFRFMDFNGYYHYSENPYRLTSSQSPIDVSNSTMVIFGLNTHQPSGSLQYTDIYGSGYVNIWYLGILIYPDDGQGNSFVKTMSITYSALVSDTSNPPVLSIPGNLLTANKTYNFIPVFSTSLYSNPVTVLDALSYIYPVTDEYIQVETQAAPPVVAITISNYAATYTQSSSTYHISFTATIAQQAVTANDGSYYTVTYGNKTRNEKFTYSAIQYGTFNVDFSDTSSSLTGVVITVYIENENTGTVTYSENQIIIPQRI